MECMRPFVTAAVLLMVVGYATAAQRASGQIKYSDNISVACTVYEYANRTSHEVTKKYKEENNRFIAIVDLGDTSFNKKDVQYLTCNCFKFSEEKLGFCTINDITYKNADKRTCKNQPYDLAGETIATVVDCPGGKPVIACWDEGNEVNSICNTVPTPMPKPTTPESTEPAGGENAVPSPQDIAAHDAPAVAEARQELTDAQTRLAEAQQAAGNAADDSFSCTWLNWCDSTEEVQQAAQERVAAAEEQVQAAEEHLRMAQAHQQVPIGGVVDGATPTAGGYGGFDPNGGDVETGNFSDGSASTGYGEGPAPTWAGDTPLPSARPSTSSGGAGGAVPTPTGAGGVGTGMGGATGYGGTSGGGSATAGSSSLGSFFGKLGEMLGKLFTSQGSQSSRSQQSQQAQEAPPKPECIAFTTTNTSISAGESATLQWVVSQADVVAINDIGTVQPVGSAKVAPSETTIYHLQAQNRYGTAQCPDVTITVAEPTATSTDALEGDPTMSCTSGKSAVVLWQCPEGTVKSVGASTEYPDFSTLGRPEGSAVVEMENGAGTFVVRCRDAYNRELGRNSCYLRPATETGAVSTDTTGGDAAARAVTSDLSVSTTRAQSGDEITLEWEGVNTTSCTLSGPDGFSQPGNKGSVTGTIYETSTFTLNCDAPSGPPTPKSVTITVI